MSLNSRRGFLSDVGKGMIAGSLGGALALDLGVTPLQADETPQNINFGDLEPLIGLMRDTPLEKLQSALVHEIKRGVTLKSLITAGTLANARAFGGQDYIGFHTFMALAPALDMSTRLPAPLKPFPVLKVLYRNTERMQATGTASRDTLRPITSPKYSGPANGETLRVATRAGDQERAEQILAAMASQPRGEIFNHVQYAVQDSTNVHRVVLAWRAWLAVDLVGEAYAQTLLRQSIRFCTDSSKYRISKNQPAPETWTSIPALLDQYKLLAKPAGEKGADDAWVDELSFEIFTGTPTSAADAAAQALASGYSIEAVGEAISLAANLQLLHDPGRPKANNADKVIGSVHGDSVGVHASDAANAWRNIARVSNHRNAVISLLLAAFNSAGMRPYMTRERWPLKRDAVQRLAQPAEVLQEIDRAVRAKDQALAGAAVERYRELGGDSKPVFDLMLLYATSEDGALHAEKFYRTVTEEFASTRDSFRWRQLVGLARVSASEFGTRSPGYIEACGLLKAEV
jgi:hypothetical protein